MTPKTNRASSIDLSVPSLGTPCIRSPLERSTVQGDQIYNFVAGTQRVLMESLIEIDVQVDRSVGFERAGPREHLLFRPDDIHAGIVTCGGLCPGINNAIRAAVLQLTFGYGVRQIWGFRYGFAGINPEEGLDALPLTVDAVDGIHYDGGSILGSSRGPQETARIVDQLERMDIRLLLVIGGDGSMRGAQAICDEVTARGAKISVVGIPKSIDNDVPLVDKTFGYETAFSLAVESIRAAHTEARGYRNGIGIVRLMGRHSGFIAASAAVAAGDANFVLIPEVPLTLHGSHGFLDALHQRIQARAHAVVVVAEGTGQDLLREADMPTERDPSGNIRLLDIGAFLRHEIEEDLHRRTVRHTVKYIDPSYLIRSAPALPSDAVYSSDLARNAVHAGMAGRTGLLIGSWNGEYTHVPLREVVTRTRTVDLEGDLWHAVLESTGQPALWG
jgi:6-phosphofructokinase 1